MKCVQLVKPQSEGCLSFLPLRSGGGVCQSLRLASLEDLARTLMGMPGPGRPSGLAQLGNPGGKGVFLGLGKLRLEALESFRLSRGKRLGTFGGLVGPLDFEPGFGRLDPRRLLAR